MSIKTPFAATALFFASGSAFAATPIIGIGTVLTMQSLGQAAPQYPNVRTFGYNTVGDGGGGDFSWTSTCPGAANGVTWIASTGVAVGCYVRSLAPTQEITAAMAGAKCDGVTNDTVRLNALIVAAGASTKIWGIERGTCLSSPLTWPSLSNQTIRIGFGAKLQANAQGNMLNMFPGSGNRIWLDGTIDCGASSFFNGACVASGGQYSINGSGTGIVQNCGNMCVLVPFVNNMMFENFSMRTGYGFCMATSGTPTNDSDSLIIESVNCDLTAVPAANVNEGFAIHGDGVGTFGFTNPRVNGITVKLPVSASVSNTSAAFEFWNAKNGVFTNISATGGAFGITILDLRGSLTNSSVYGPSVFGIECANCLQAQGATITGNSIDGAGLAAYGIAFDNNTGSGNGHNTITGNTVTNLALGSNAGAYWIGTSNTSVGSNFADSGTYCVVFETVLYGTATGNTCRSATGSGGIVSIESSNIVMNSNNVNWGGNACQIVASTGPTRNYIFATTNILLGTGNNDCLQTGSNFGANVVITGNVP